MKNGFITIRTNVAFSVIVENFGTMPQRLHKSKVLDLAIPQELTAIVLNTEEPIRKEHSQDEGKYLIKDTEIIDLSTLAKEKERGSFDRVTSATHQPLLEEHEDGPNPPLKGEDSTIQRNLTGN